MKQPYADDGGDRLSALPDCLLHTVMSFLSARQAVQTCVLSRRWRGLWLSMPCLDIDGDEYRPATAGGGGATITERWERLENFTTSLLFAHNAPFLDRFRLHLPNFQRITATQQHHGRQMERWILRGFRYRPAALEIAARVAAVAFKLPLLGASSASRLRDCIFPAWFWTAASCIRSWCPVLEAMELKACIFEDLKEIVSSTIKSLAIVDCRSGHQTDALVCRMDSLVEASISGTRFGSDFDKMISTLIGSLINVRELDVSWFQPVELKYGESANFQTFHKLTTLNIYECDLGQNLHILLSFLQNTPNLEKVILQNCEISDHSRKRKRTPKANRNQIHSKRRSLITSKSEISKIMKMTYEDDDLELGAPRND
uniref:F-box domain-containing protein n=1 Tax=Oryza barthii TaxID=65489 RepID=A0A0D3FSZ9_9ORYZ